MHGKAGVDKGKRGIRVTAELPRSRQLMFRFEIEMWSAWEMGRVEVLVVREREIVYLRN